jgi:hypothetical protein
MDAIKDIPTFLRSLRLHKYTDIFQHDDWRRMIFLTDQDLERRGVTTVGARRKLLKVFELYIKETQNNSNIKK